MNRDFLSLRGNTGGRNVCHETSSDVAVGKLLWHSRKQHAFHEGASCCNANTTSHAATRNASIMPTSSVSQWRVWDVHVKGAQSTHKVLPNAVSWILQGTEADKQGQLPRRCPPATFQGRLMLSHHQHSRMLSLKKLTSHCDQSRKRGLVSATSKV